MRTGEGPSEIQVPRSLVANSTDIIHAWTLEGAGIAVKALWDVEDDLKQGRLVELLAQYGADDIHLYAAYSSRRHVPLRLRKFIDFMVDVLPAEVEDIGSAGPFT